jgi:copper(I)-binding protein
MRESWISMLAVVGVLGHAAAAAPHSMAIAGAALPAAAFGHVASRPGVFAGEAPMLSRVADKKPASPTYSVGALVIEAPWARATPGGAKVAGGYLKITNTGKEPDRLIGGSLPIAAEVEVHEMAMANNVMKMRRLAEGLEIRPGQSVELKPGGFHLMFVGLTSGLKAGQPVKGTLRFEKAGTVEVEYRVAPIGAQSGGGHAHH